MRWMLAPTAFDVDSCCVTRFTPLHAPVISGWVADQRELLWLAPATAPPLTAEKVNNWSRSEQQRFVLWHTPTRRPIGYSELDFLQPLRDQMWIGHFIIDPAVRGMGLGHVFASTLLNMAFDRFAAQHVLLLVFPENRAAVRCYERLGFVETGAEVKRFDQQPEECVLMRMLLERSRYRRLAATRMAPSPALPFVPEAADVPISMT
mgnify:CR=1 FL=1